MSQGNTSQNTGELHGHDSDWAAQIYLARKEDGRKTANQPAYAAVYKPNPTFYSSAQNGLFKQTMLRNYSQMTINATQWNLSSIRFRSMKLGEYVPNGYRRVVGRCEDLAPYDCFTTMYLFCLFCFLLEKSEFVSTKPPEPNHVDAELCHTHAPGRHCGRWENLFEASVWTRHLSTPYFYLYLPSCPAAFFSLFLFLTNQLHHVLIYDWTIDFPRDSYCCNDRLFIDFLTVK